MLLAFFIAFLPLSGSFRKRIAAVTYFLKPVVIGFTPLSF